MGKEINYRGKGTTGVGNDILSGNHTAGATRKDCDSLAHCQIIRTFHRYFFRLNSKKINLFSQKY